MFSDSRISGQILVVIAVSRNASLRIAISTLDAQLHRLHSFYSNGKLDFLFVGQKPPGNLRPRNPRGKKLCDYIDLKPSSKLNFIKLHDFLLTDTLIYLNDVRVEGSSCLTTARKNSSSRARSYLSKPTNFSRLYNFIMFFR